MLMRILPVFSREYPNFFEKIIKEAEKTILIITYLLSTEAKTKKYIIEKIKQAQSRGVKIIIITNGIFRNKETRKIQNMVVNELRKEGIKIIFNNQRATEHRKIIIADEKKVLIGSHNLTASSFRKSKEISIYFESQEVAKRILEKIKKEYNF